MHIFISYAKAETYDFAIQLQDELRQLPDVTVWMDETLIPGESWAAQIQSEIRRCDLVVVLLSPDVNREPDAERGHSFVINEIEFAQRRKKSIIPVMVQHTDMPIQIATLQYIDFTPNDDSGLKRLTQDIIRRTGTVAVVEPILPPEPTPSTLPFSPVLTQQSSIPPTLTPDPLPFSPVPIQQQTASVKPPTVSPPTTAPVQIVIARTFVPVYHRPPFVIGVIALILVIGIAIIRPILIPTTSIPTASVSIPLGSVGNPVTRNADWTPRSQTFDGVEMVLVPVGCFMMGSDDSNDDEKPVIEQCVQEPFWIDKTEVTNQYYGSEGDFKGDNRPRGAVTWFQARDFCTAHGKRLPTELEWEYVARGPDSLVYPWGNDFVADNLVYSGNSNSQLANVSSKPAGNSWVGASDLSGNLWEWVSSIFQPYPYTTDDGRETNSDSTNVLRVLRGGSWVDSGVFVRASFRAGFSPTYGHVGLGFRCVYFS